MRRISVQIDVQDGIGPAEGLEPCFLFAPGLFAKRLLFPKRQIVAQGREPCSVMHVPRVVPSKLAMQGISVGVFLGNEGKADPLALQLRSGTQRAHDTRGFVRVLTAADEQSGPPARDVRGEDGAALA